MVRPTRNENERVVNGEPGEQLILALSAARRRENSERLTRGGEDMRGSFAVCKSSFYASRAACLRPPA
jgi:hypothetical protein